MKHRQSHTPPSPCGKSLVEMVVVMGLVSVVLTLSGQMLTSLVRAERNSARWVAESVALSRLAREFRRDVHSAREAEIQPADNRMPRELFLNLPHELSLNLPGGRTVVYTAESNRTLRQEIDAHGQVLTQDTWPAADQVVTFSRSDDGRRVILEQRRERTSRPQQHGNLPQRNARVIALLNRDERFAPAAASGTPAP